MTHYHYGHNSPGYLPESDPGSTDSWQEAVTGIASEMRHHADDMEENGKRSWLATTLRVEANRLEDEELAPEWGDTIGGTAYWIMPCDDECDLDN